ncbi:MAG: IS5 family transposase [Acidimicrobiales bacterium]
MRALEPEVVDAVWAAVEPLLPPPARSHPLGCHRRRVPDRICFEAMLIRLVTGCSWVDAEHLVGRAVSDTTLRARRDEWEAVGVFAALAEEALRAYDKIIGLDLSETALDGSQHKAPMGGEGTGPNPTDRGKSGWKWSLLTDRDGIPVGWATDGANRHDTVLFGSTLEAAGRRGLLFDIETLHLDRGYDSKAVRSNCRELGLDDIVCARQRRTGTKPGQRRTPKPRPLGLRWTVERTNSWLSNFGQLRRNTDRRIAHRLTQMALAITLLITAKLIDWRNRWAI